MADPQQKGLISKSYEWASGKIRGRDLFGIPISLTYKGDTEYKTGIGGFTSIIVLLILCYYSVLLLIMVIERGESTVTKNTIYTDLTYDPTVYNLGENNFNFGVALVHNDGTDMMLNSSLLTMEIDQVNWYGEDVGDNHESNLTSLSYSVCTTDAFTHLNLDTLETLNVFNEYYCPDETDYKVSGNLISTNYNYVRIRVTKCSGEPYCETEATIDDVLQKVELKLAIANSYFDLDDYDEPVKYFFDDELRWKLMPGFKLSKYVQVQRNEADVYDDPWPWSTSKSYVFFGTEKTLNKMELEDSGEQGEIFEIRIRLDTSHHVYNRKVYTVGDMFSQIGGIFEVLLLGGGFIVGVFSHKLYLSSLMSNLYHVNTNDINRDSKPQSVAPGSLRDIGNIEDVGVIHRRDTCHLKENSNDKLSLNTSRQNNDEMKVEAARRTILGRKRFKNSCKDIFYSIFCCPNIKCFDRSSETPHTVKGRHKLLKKGEEIMTNEFDITSIIKSMRRSSDMRKLQLSSSQIHLLNIASNIVLNSKPSQLDLSTEQSECNFDTDSNAKSMIEGVFENLRRHDLSKVDKRLLALINGETEIIQSKDEELDLDYSLKSLKGKEEAKSSNV